jgi:hypothetical protein
MESFKEQNQKSHDLQSSVYAWTGLTNVEIAREIYKDLECFIEDESEEYIVWRMSRILEKVRTY